VIYAQQISKSPLEVGHQTTPVDDIDLAPIMELDVRRVLVGGVGLDPLVTFEQLLARLDILHLRELLLEDASFGQRFVHLGPGARLVRGLARGLRRGDLLRARARLIRGRLRLRLLLAAKGQQHARKHQARYPSCVHLSLLHVCVH